MRRKLNWVHITYHVPTIASDCGDCAINQVGLRRKRHVELFLVSGPVEFVAMYTLGPLPKKTPWNQLIIVIMNKYT